MEIWKERRTYTEQLRKKERPDALPVRGNVLSKKARGAGVKRE